MDEIYEPDTTFDFKRLVLCPPAIIPGGNYFIKFKMNDEPLYIQCPKSTTKQGIVKAGKKFYCDIMLSNENYDFIQWMENLETYCQETIFDNREKWFEAGLEKHDIENSFLSSLKTYKSGKFYIMRTNLPSRLGKNVLKIYDENENNVDMADIKENSNIITILEIQGIKCSARSFQIEIEIKQMMVIKPSQLFERCIIKTRPQMVANLPDEIVSEIKPETRDTKNTTSTEIDESINLEKVSNVEEIRQTTEELAVVATDDPADENSEDDIFARPVKKLAEPTKPSDIIEEVQFDLAEIPETEKVQLKKRNDVYYKMYRDAMRNAKIAKDLALSSYLEAKRIKNTYMLTDVDDSDESDIESSLDVDDGDHE